ncbi:Non-specific lipid transfer protein GPI-anchored 1 [Bienertia sinuspersici]
MSKLKLVLVILATLSINGLKPCEAETSLTQQCSTAIQQLISCLNFAKGAAPTPTKECCTSVTGMKEKQPVCLCFFIGQAHNGSEQIKSLGIQEAKLLQLPSACHLNNASASNCPKLLGISPSSPAAAIFMNKNGTSSSSTSSSSSSADLTGGALPSNSHTNNGVLSTFFSVFVSIILSAFM